MARVITSENLDEITQEALRITAEINGKYHTIEENRALMSRLTGRELDDTFVFSPPFYTDCGKNIRFGKNVFLNCGCFFQDLGGIYIGDDVQIGPGVSIVTINHNLDPAKREERFPAPVIIRDNVWIGANATILPGVVIGRGAVVGAGSVVIDDVKPYTVVAGNPATYRKDVPYVSSYES